MRAGLALAGYDYFLRVGREVQWDERELDLSRDAASWPALPDATRAPVGALLAGFCVAEWAVAAELDAFAAAADDPRAVECFRVQAGDEARHSRFFDRVVHEVLAVPGATREARRTAVRASVDPRFLELFEDRLPARAAAVAAEGGVAAGVGLYHLVLEGVVLVAGQFALLDLLRASGALPGVLAGVELVHRDERWHIGFGTRCLQDLAADPDVLARVRAEGEEAADAWGAALDPAHRDRMVRLHHRRLRAAGLLASE